jgi:hypothetical protein
VGTVVMHNAVSVDGFIADENDDVGPLHEWYFNGDTPITDDHVVVVSHRPKPEGWHPEASYHFVDGVTDPHVVIQGDRVLHLRFRVRR